ncbi:MAG: hypothetical protein EHM28_07630, partial [Spirochaetaceae bacterium]
ILKKYIEIFCIQMEISPEISRRYLNDTELAPVISALPSKEYMQALSDELVNNIPGNKNCSLAIADFSWQGTAMPQLPNFVRESLLACMSRGNNHSIVERQKFDYILREQELSISDLLDTSTAIRIGKISAAQYIITGTIMEMSSSILIFGRIIDVETGIVKAVAQVIIPREKIVL